MPHPAPLPNAVFFLTPSLAYAALFAYPWTLFLLTGGLIVLLLLIKLVQRRQFDYRRSFRWALAGLAPLVVLAIGFGLLAVAPTERPGIGWITGPAMRSPFFDFYLDSFLAGMEAGEAERHAGALFSLATESLVYVFVVPASGLMLWSMVVAEDRMRLESRPAKAPPLAKIDLRIIRRGVLLFGVLGCLALAWYLYWIMGGTSGSVSLSNPVRNAGRGGVLKFLYASYWLAVLAAPFWAVYALPIYLGYLRARPVWLAAQVRRRAPQPDSRRN